MLHICEQPLTHPHTTSTTPADDGKDCMVFQMPVTPFSVVHQRMRTLAIDYQSTPHHPPEQTAREQENSTRGTKQKRLNRHGKAPKTPLEGDKEMSVTYSLTRTLTHPVTPPPPSNKHPLTHTL